MTKYQYTLTPFFCGQLDSAQKISGSFDGPFPATPRKLLNLVKKTDSKLSNGPWRNYLNEAGMVGYRWGNNAILIIKRIGGP